MEANTLNSDQTTHKQQYKLLKISEDLKADGKEKG